MPPNAQPTRLPQLVTIAGCLSVNTGVSIWALLTRPAFNSDFRGPWSFALFARSHGATIYQPTALQAFQHQLYPGFTSFFPYQYPPTALLSMLWLGDFSYPTAQIIWTISGLAALAAAGWVLFEPNLRWIAVAALLAAPASLLNGAAGETGFFTAALLLAGFGLLPSRPALAGIGFGLLTLKPQLGLLIPVALLARGDYRAIFSAGFTALALAVLSCVIFPAAIWADWLHQIPIYHAQYLAAAKIMRLDADVTIAGNLSRIGLPPGLSQLVQILASLASATAVFFAFRQPRYHLALAAFFIGGLLCAPHAYVYDTIPTTAAMLLLDPNGIAPILLCLAAFLAPVLLFTRADAWFVYAIPETLLFLWIIYLALSPARRPDIHL